MLRSGYQLKQYHHYDTIRGSKVCSWCRCFTDASAMNTSVNFDYWTESPVAHRHQTLDKNDLDEMFQFSKFWNVPYKNVRIFPDSHTRFFFPTTGSKKKWWQWKWWGDLHHCESFSQLSQHAQCSHHLTTLSQTHLYTLIVIVFFLGYFTVFF